MKRAACKVLEYLIIRLKHKEDGMRRTAPVDADLSVAVNATGSTNSMDTFYCIMTIAAKGQWLSKTVNDELHKVIRPVLEDLSIHVYEDQEACIRFGKHIGPLMSFQITFKVTEAQLTLMRDCVFLDQFLHRLSIVHTQVKIQYQVTVNDVVSCQSYSEKKETMFHFSEKSLLTDKKHYIRFETLADSYCSRIHPVAGQSVSLLIPNEASELGLCGELVMVPLAALCPCFRQHPNRPSRISSVSIYLYGPSNLPVLIEAEQDGLPFFEEPSNIASWDRFKLVLNMENALTEGIVRPDVSYSIHKEDEIKASKTDKQTILLFLFIDFWDMFHTELVDIAGNHSTMVQCLNQVLLCNKATVKGAIQTVLDKILEEHFKTEKNQQKIKLAIPVIQGCIQSIVCSSTNNAFRKKCLQTFQVEDTRELEKAVQQSLKKAIQSRFLSCSMCNNKKVVSLENKLTQSDTISSTLSASQEEPFEEEEDSFESICAEQGLLLSEINSNINNRDCESTLSTQKSNEKYTIASKCGLTVLKTGDESRRSQEGNIAFFAKKMRMENPLSSTNCQQPTETQPIICKQDPKKLADSGHCQQKTTHSSATLDLCKSKANQCQEDDLWFQEVSNLDEWI